MCFVVAVALHSNLFMFFCFFFNKLLSFFQLFPMAMARFFHFVYETLGKHEIRARKIKNETLKRIFVYFAKVLYPFGATNRQCTVCSVLHTFFNAISFPRKSKLK